MHADRSDQFEPLPPHRRDRWIRYGQGDTTYYAALLGLVVEDVRLDYCRMRLPWRTEISQPFGVAHGGAVASLVDTVLVPAIGAGYDDPVGFATVAMSVQFMGAIRDEDAVGEGWLTRRGSTMVFGEAEVHGADSGRLVARGLVTYKLSGVKSKSDVGR